MGFLQHGAIGEAGWVQIDGANGGALIQGRVLALISFVGGHQIRGGTYRELSKSIRHIKRPYRPVGHQNNPVVIGSIETVLSGLMILHAHRRNVGHNFVNQIQVSDGIVFLECYPSLCIVRRNRNIFWLKVLRQGSDG